MSLTFWLQSNVAPPFFRGLRIGVGVLVDFGADFDGIRPVILSGEVECESKEQRARGNHCPDSTPLRQHAFVRYNVALRAGAVP